MEISEQEVIYDVIGQIETEIEALEHVPTGSEGEAQELIDQLTNWSDRLREVAYGYG